jgi:hypothetical protein
MKNMSDLRMFLEPMGKTMEKDGKVLKSKKSSWQPDLTKTKALPLGVYCCVMLKYSANHVDVTSSYHQQREENEPGPDQRDNSAKMTT